MVSRNVSSPLRLTISYLSELPSFSAEPSGITPLILLDAQVPSTRGTGRLPSSFPSMEITTLSPMPPMDEKPEARFRDGADALASLFFGI